MTTDDQQKLYALHTTAPYRVVSDIAVHVAMKHGHVATLTETPDGSIITLPLRRHWGAARWWGVFVTLISAPTLFHFVPLTALQGFALGWIAGVLILLVGRRP